MGSNLNMRATETTMSNMIPLYLDQIEVNGTPSLRIWIIKHGWRRWGCDSFDPYDVTVKHFLQRDTAIGYAEALVAESKRADWGKDRLRSEDVSAYEEEAFGTPLRWGSESGNQYLSIVSVLAE